MTYKVWRSGDSVAIESGQERIVLSVEDAARLGAELVPEAHAGPLTPALRKTKFVALWKRGAKSTEISREVGISKKSVSYFRQQYGLPPRRAANPKALAAMAAGKARLVKVVR